MDTNGKRLFIARHGETVFNAAGRMQGMDAHTPLTREGCEQATAMGHALSRFVDPGHDLQLVASPSGRTSMAWPGWAFSRAMALSPRRWR